MSWEKQPRDAKGRFLSKAVEPVKTKAKTKKVSKKLTQVNIFVIDDSASIASNNMVDSIVTGMDDIIKDVLSENEDPMFWGLSMFGKYSNRHYSFSSQPLKLINYNPIQSFTALNDGIAYAIENTAYYIQSNKIQNPSVVFNIFTDGQENNSREYTTEKINALISKKRDDGWMINFIGGGDPKVVKETAKDLGIFAANTVVYNTNSVGTAEVFDKLSESMRGYSKSVKEGKTSNTGFFGR